MHCLYLLVKKSYKSKYTGEAGEETSHCRVILKNEVDRKRGIKKGKSGVTLPSLFTFLESGYA